MAEVTNPPQPTQNGTTDDDGLPVPLSPAAVEARTQMLKLVSEMEEAERARRIAVEQDEDQNKSRVSAINKLITVQEDLLRCISLKKVKEAELIEQAQRMTEERKRDVHEELVRKAVQKEVLKDEEQERQRRIKEGTDVDSDESKQRMKTYNRLIVVQEDLLRHCRKIEADLAVKESQQISITENNKAAMQEELLHQASRRQATELSNQEQTRQIEELSHLTDEDVQKRVAMAAKLLQVHKEILSTRQPTNAIPEHHTTQVLEDYKIYMQEQLVRKAHQKDALEAMDKEKERRVAEDKTKKVNMSDEKAAILEEISRKKSSKQAAEMAENTRQEYILEQKKAQVQSDTIRQINQKKADQSMDNEQKERIKEMEGKKPAVISDELKKEIIEHK